VGQEADGVGVFLFFDQPLEELGRRQVRRQEPARGVLEVQVAANLRRRSA
jgi:hypothetical protein